MKPPAVMANRLSPDSRNPTAAPGRMACAMASPTSDMRRSIRNTPTGPAPSASASAPASARRMNSNSVKGAMKRSCMDPNTPYAAVTLCRGLRRRAFGGVLIERLAHAPRGKQVFRCQHRRGAAPGDRLAREQQRFREMRPDEIDIVQRREHGALLAMPALHQVAKSGGGLWGTR